MYTVSSNLLVKRLASLFTSRSVPSIQLFVLLGGLSFLGLWSGNAQNQDSTAVDALNSVHIIAHTNRQPLQQLNTAAQILGQAQLSATYTSSLVPALNQVAGLRMEERSPGSYRIALRGNLIRSPFGVRNLQVYLGDFPLTDASGNTYINLIDPAALAQVQVLKGPNASLYGANSGGVIRLEPKGFNVQENKQQISLGGGAYGLFREHFSLQRSYERYSFSIDQMYQQSDGYRDHTALNKKSIQTAHRYQYATNSELRFLLLYTDLHYETPGGLTREQLEEQRRMARPASSRFPSAEAQEAGIQNRSLLGGITHQIAINKHWQHQISLFGSYTDFENPFITNYEFRKEENIGLRTYLSYQNQIATAWHFEAQLGYEGQKGWYALQNFDNNQGEPQGLQAQDDLTNGRQNYFLRTQIGWKEKLSIETSLGYHNFTLGYTTHFPSSARAQGEVNYDAIWMPRIAGRYTFNRQWSMRASVARGFSAPTLAEVRSSTNQINTDLKAEEGVNYELGFRFQHPKQWLVLDLSAYTYPIESGIVRQLNAAGNEYFVNAGELKQNGIELTGEFRLLPEDSSRLLHSLQWHTALTYNHHEFERYIVKENNYSGNPVTSVPDWMLANSLNFAMGKPWSMVVKHRYTSRIPLNDANTVFSKAFHLVQLQLNWQQRFGYAMRFRLFAGVNNLLNERYSLGNDINAFGKRYFNPAPERNIYAGLHWRF